MKRKLVQSGNGWAIYIQKSLLKLLQIDSASSLAVFTVEYKILKIRKIEKKEAESLENPMVKKFIKSGRGVALYISNSILKLLDINPETDEVEYAVNNGILEIRKA